jgi:1,4-alpha-glucan branching enzyme
VTSERDVYLFREGTHSRLYQVLGARPDPAGQGEGTRFAVWAPNAESVSVIGEFNGWRAGADPLRPRHDGSGLWEGMVPAAQPGDLYKYRIDAEAGRFSADRGDPFARWWEAPPGNASRIWREGPVWGDETWMRGRGRRHGEGAPLAVYEVHLGSWRRVVLPDGGTRFLSYGEAADALADYVAEFGFTHVELLPVMEHPDYASLGYGTSGHFAPTARYGRPEGLMRLIDLLHQRGIGVILDWAPALSGGGAETLVRYDGSALFERVGRLDPEAAGGGLGFDVARPEVRSFLLSAALYWFDRYHVDGLRVAGASDMLRRGGGEAPAAAAFLRQLNAAVHHTYPDALGIIGERIEVEEGLGFALEWDRGWSQASLAEAPAHRVPRQDSFALGAAEAASRRVLPLSHELVGGGAGSLIARMPGDDWQRRARLRLLLGSLYACPGSKLLFMGTEIGQEQGWHPESSLDWHLLERPGHRGIKTWVRDLNQRYRHTPVLFQRDLDPGGAALMAVEGGSDGIAALLRRGSAPDELMLVVFNRRPEPVVACRIGVPRGGWWHEVLNSDAWMYGGSGQGNLGGVDADPVPVGGQYSSLLLTLPPLGVLFLQYQGQGPAQGGRQ